jgi:hypothetical protein
MTRTLWYAAVAGIAGIAVRVGGTWVRTGQLPYLVRYAVPGALLLVVLVLVAEAVLRWRSAPGCPEAASSPAA